MYHVLYVFCQHLLFFKPTALCISWKSFRNGTATRGSSSRCPSGASVPSWKQWCPCFFLSSLTDGAFSASRQPSFHFASARASLWVVRKIGTSSMKYCKGKNLYKYSHVTHDIELKPQMAYTLEKHNLVYKSVQGVQVQQCTLWNWLF